MVYHHRKLFIVFIALLWTMVSNICFINASCFAFTPESSTKKTSHACCDDEQSTSSTHCEECGLCIKTVPSKQIGLEKTSSVNLDKLLRFSALIESTLSPHIAFVQRKPLLDNHEISIQTRCFIQESISPNAPPVELL